MMTAEQLKASILQMAMQGKLVEQRAEEGTGEDIIGNISKTNHFKPIKYTDIAEIEKEYDIPDSWAWVQLENIATLFNGRAYKQNELLDAGKTPILRVGNLFTSEKWYYSDLELDGNKYCESEDLLYSWSASFGPFIWRGGKVIYHYHIWKVEYAPDIFRDYLYYYLLTETQRIKANGHGLAMIHVTKAGMEKILVPLPPLEEQKRIVAKIEELMPFVEEYAKASTRLNTLNASFPEQMKKSILQQAVMGRLVPQDPNDEPASVLLKKIAEEKQKLIKEGKIKKQKALPAITEAEIPFDIPESWEWSTINDLFWVTKLAGFEYTKYFKKDAISDKNAVHIVRAKNVRMGYFVENADEAITQDLSELLERSALTKDCLLMTFIGAGIGDTCIYRSEDRHHLAPNVAKIEPQTDNIYLEYYLIWLMSPAGQRYVDGIKKQTAQPSLSMETIRSIKVAVPPLAEQKRIMKKVKSIMPEIETSLAKYKSR